ncbi:Trifunctional UDP-glucose 4,6-dehydratase/UDP-4-keto-6-deoxy-D-glucose 3,5-epimerase/UDP-4-keto-L-rhamnose-reductase RHM1 [Hibiscus syriacus]|uniref:Trifunctional UDP-glucose 4,6-dehydratase/UDP-4-keto-6-deoxy-D-glucose 3,5-epimerase/UDP-4-keto-L-rhamnose-reductase RHM1 n=1 Tax=Hibiscus syriacus TaxID=106335 RepID=A0A6A2WZX1_HIBSY|nr:Trifunctional UDP-glucose 4,6-dehydratase/UDP-4-keto-6-deoxy-D-glucose 3,5-epimerase/UDP-4-keto-L-rhamnose-reductase RHM1 [Hibiscus syriacus]
MANRYTPKSILVTGAAGFIASHVCNRLIRNYPDYKIVVLDKLDYCSSLKNLDPSRSSPNFKFIKGDIASADLVHFILQTESIDTIMHFAAQTHVDNSFGNSIEFTKNNIYGTHVLLEACKVTGQIKRFIHVSTDEVYGETDEDAVVGNHEASQLLPTNPYSATKAGAEMLVMAYGRSYGLPVITTRGNNVYGTNQFPEKLIPKFILLAMKRKILPIHGDGSNVRSYLYCEDVAEAFEVILHRGEVGHVYNIGTKKERTVIDLKSLGWYERTTWEEGLKKTMEWYVSNPGWWGDVSGALLPHPRMLMVPGIGRQFDAPDTTDLDSAPITNKFSQTRCWTGWIGGLLGKLCEHKAYFTTGVTGRPNVDWCETHKHETIRTNVVGTLTLADVCREHGLLMINYATGCIFEYDATHSIGTESVSRRKIIPISLVLSIPKPSHGRRASEGIRQRMHSKSPDAYIIRSQQPKELHHKITRYNKVVDIPNSMTILDELLPVSIEMANRNLRGIWNFTNPGVVSHNEICRCTRTTLTQASTGLTSPWRNKPR